MKQKMSNMNKQIAKNMEQKTSKKSAGTKKLTRAIMHIGDTIKNKCVPAHDSRSISPTWNNTFCKYLKISRAGCKCTLDAYMNLRAILS